MNRPKFPTPEPIPDSVRDYLERLMLALGQMKHPKEARESGMLLDAELRSHLIHEGHVILGYPGFKPLE
jgi:hypothetical protein